MLKKLGLTALALLALKGGYAQSITPSEKKLPVIPVFEVKYDPSMSVVGANGEVSWKSRHYKKESDYIGEIRGYANIDVGFWPFRTKVYVGFITRINYNKNTIETITYNNGAKDSVIENGQKIEKDKVLTDYEKRIARRESIDTLLANDVSAEFSNYISGKLVDMETHKVADSDSYGLQESYFFATTKTDGKRHGVNDTFKVHLKGKEYSIPVRDSADVDGKFLYVDLQVDDPKTPGKKMNVLEQINWLKIYYDNATVPKRVVAEVNIGILGITKEIELNLKP